MNATSGTLLVDDREEPVSVVVRDGDFLLDSADFNRATGWHLKDRGLCRGDTCLPVDDRGNFVEEGFLKLSAVADRLNRTFAVHPDPPVAYLGPSKNQVRDRLEAGRAPDFILPDWKNERTVSLSDFEGDKIFLLVWASW